MIDTIILRLIDMWISADVLRTLHKNRKIKEGWNELELEETSRKNDSDTLSGIGPLVGEPIGC